MVGLGMVACYRKLCGTDESPTNNALVMQPAQGQSLKLVCDEEIHIGLVSSMWLASNSLVISVVAHQQSWCVVACTGKMIGLNTDSAKYRMAWE